MLQHLRGGAFCCGNSVLVVGACGVIGVCYGGGRKAEEGGHMPAGQLPIRAAAAVAPSCALLTRRSYTAVLQVRESYRTKGWALLDVEKVEQCHHEG